MSHHGGPEREPVQDVFFEADGLDEHRKNEEHGLFKLSARLLLYSVVIAAVLVGFLETVETSGLQLLLRENGPLERTQLMLLLMSSLVLVLLSNRRSTVVFRFMAIFPCMAAAREMDTVFETRFFEDAHKVVIAALCILAAVYFMRHRRTVVPQLHAVLGTRSFGMLFTAVALVLVVSRLLGQQAVWEAALGDMYVRSIPRFIEESCELVGYLILALGSIEIWFDAKATHTGRTALASRAHRSAA